MTTIQIAYDVTPAAVERVRTLLDDVALRDPNWNGAEFVIERDDYTCIPDRDDADACALLASIHHALRDD